MTDKRKLPKIMPTRETIKALENLDRSGECHPMNTGRPGVFVAVPEHIHPLIGVEGGAMWKGERVTVLGPHPSEEYTLVYLRLPCGDFVWRDPDTITPAPKTRTVTLEVEVPTSVDPRHLGLFERGREPYSGQPVHYRIIAIDGEEVDR